MSPLSGERDEVKRLETGAAEDLSAGAQDADSRILTENINDQRLQRVFRQWAFFGVGVVFLGTFSALLGWVVLIGMNIMDQSITTTYRASLFGHLEKPLHPGL